MSDPSTSNDEYVRQLANAVSAMTPAEFLASKGADLKTAGLYSWWVDASGAADLSRGLGLPINAGVIYAGQAGATRLRSRSKSKSTLWSRLSRNHLGGNHRSSTLRRTLGSILASADHWSEVDEAALTAWMCEHLRVIPIPVADRESLDLLESEVVASLDPPFNLSKVPTSAIRRRLTVLRRDLVSLPTVLPTLPRPSK